jgi:heptose I phosphotransferase
VPVLSLPRHLQQLFGENAFDEIMQLKGRVFRDVPGRKTMRITLGDQQYFIKQHFGIGWAEIFKSLISLKKPVIGAMTEVHAIEKLTDIGIPTTPLVAYGYRGINPAAMESFVITEDLGEIISLEDLCSEWMNKPPSVDFKQNLVKAVAELAAKLHGAGLAHRDFYLCHIIFKKESLVNNEVCLYLIDLHRMLLNQPSHGNAAMKDIAALYFSAMDCGLKEEDLSLFKQYYLTKTEKFWRQVEARAKKLYAKYNSEKFQKRLEVERSVIDQP